MGNIQFNAGKVLFVGTKIAMDAACCCVTNPCTHCEAGCTGVGDLTVDIPALRVISCPDCADFADNPWVLTYMGQEPFGCIWDFTGDYPCPPPVPLIRAVLSFGGGNYELTLLLTLSGVTIAWVVSFGGTKPCCTDWNNLELPWDSHPGVLPVCLMFVSPLSAFVTM